MPTKSSVKPHRKRRRRTRGAPNARTTGRRTPGRSRPAERSAGADTTPAEPSGTTAAVARPAAAVVKEVRRLEARWRKLLPKLRAHARRRR